MKNWNLTVNYIHGEQIAPFNSPCFQRIKKDTSNLYEQGEKTLLFLWVDSQAATATDRKSVLIRVRKFESFSAHHKGFLVQWQSDRLLTDLRLFDFSQNPPSW